MKQISIQDLHYAILTLIETASDRANEIKSAKNETMTFLNSGFYSEEEYDSVMEDLENELQGISDSADVMLEFSTILNRLDRAKANMREVNKEISALFDL